MMPSLGNKVAGVDRKSKLKDACNVSESERLIAGSRWILNRTVAMGMNCGTRTWSCQTEEVEGGSSTSGSSGGQQNNPPNPRVGVSGVWEFSDCTHHDP